MSVTPSTETAIGHGTQEDAATTAAALRQASRTGPFAEVHRFDGVERAVHWSTAALLLALIVTGTILYIPTFALAVGHRAVVENIHVITGIGLLLPLIVGVLGPWRASLLGDLRRFDGWTRADWEWFRRRAKRKAQRGKFNGGQKLEAALLGGGMTVMLITGVVMRWSPQVFPLNWATGATFVHDIFYVVLFFAVVAHIALSLNNPDQMKAMLTGRIPRKWAQEHAPAWLTEIDDSEAQPRS
jgi:formate dehydrogenase subunit gamma